MIIFDDEMIIFDDVPKIKKEPIQIQKLLKEVNLPIRIINILRKRNYYSEEEFYKTVDQLILKYTSHYLFPNHLMAFYPQVIERTAKCELICNLSGARIMKGSIYYTYHPFIEDLKNGKVYVIKKNIHAEIGYVDYFPQDLFTYEEWYYKVKNAYYGNDGVIDFYYLSRHCGESCLEPYLLDFSKKKRKK